VKKGGFSCVSGQTVDIGKRKDIKKGRPVQHLKRGRERFLGTEDRGWGGEC